MICKRLLQLLMKKKEMNTKQRYIHKGFKGRENKQT